MILPGCATAPVERAQNAVVAVRIDDKPDVALLACPEKPAPLPEDIEATLPASLRSALIALAKSYRATREQLIRLVNWHDPGSCR